ncbi:type II toxin-antitoxin system ParD family antitoxin [Rhizobium sp.]
MRNHQALTERDEAFIRRQIESGRYEDREAVIQAGLRMLEEFEDAQEQWLEEVIPARHAELQRDPSRAVSLEAARARFKQRHNADMAKTK